LVEVLHVGHFNPDRELADDMQQAQRRLLLPGERDRLPQAVPGGFAAVEGNEDSLVHESSLRVTAAPPAPAPGSRARPARPGCPSRTSSLTPRLISNVTCQHRI